MRTGFLLILFIISMACNAQEKLVRANGIQFNVHVKGIESRVPGKPVIVFENGMGVGLDNWDKIIGEIASFAPVMAYDRAGIGKSEKVYQMPGIKFVNENLHAILKTLNIPPPYILVGHSFGGVYIRTYAGFYPDEVAGLVFVDPADFTETKNDWNNIFRTLGLPEEKIEAMLRRRLYQVSKTDSLNYGPWSELQVLTELRRNDFAEVSKLPLPSVPVYFFVGGKFEVPVEMRSKEYDQEKFFHVKNNSNMDRWKHLIYASKKPGALIYLTNAGHYIQRDEPESVIANIKILTDAVNKDRAGKSSDGTVIKKGIEDFTNAVESDEMKTKYQNINDGT